MSLRPINTPRPSPSENWYAWLVIERLRARFEAEVQVALERSIA